MCICNSLVSITFTRGFSSRGSPAVSYIVQREDVPKGLEHAARTKDTFVDAALLGTCCRRSSVWNVLLHCLVWLER